MDDNGAVLREALAWVAEGRSAALATVVATWGSSPCAVGARLAVDESGHFIGSVSGGCIEGDVLVNAEEAIAAGAPRLLEFDAGGGVWAPGLACGGRLKVLVEPLSEVSALERIAAGLDRGRETAALVDVRSGARSEIEAGALPDGLGEADRRACVEALGRGADALLDLSTGQYFLEFWRSPPRLFVIGAVHIAQALAPMATLAGYRVALVDPRAAFAASERFPCVTLRAEWPDAFFARVPLDSRCAVVALSHEPRIDDPALVAALRSPAFYIGALGSRGNAERRRDRLRALGFSEEALARVHGPVGLSIGALSPAEIAIAVMAEMTAVLRQGRACERESAAPAPVFATERGPTQVFPKVFPKVFPSAAE
jgi:xanthine dehydrogenase accessory factor